MAMLVIGGSFNPIHNGHLLVSRAVAEAIGFSRVLLIPSAQPPHKKAAVDMADARHRLAMCQLVSDDDPFFQTSDIELRRQGPSFTLDTARQLQTDGWNEVHWLIGADMLMYLPAWHQPEALLNTVHFHIAQRPGHAIDWDALPPMFHPLQSQVVKAPLIDISASQIRERIRRGLSVRYMTPQAVERYMIEQHLYQTG